jgi:hypothetical protein
MKSENSRFHGVQKVSYLKSDKVHYCNGCGERFRDDEIATAVNHYIKNHDYEIDSTRLGKDISFLLVRDHA